LPIAIFFTIEKWLLNNLSRKKIFIVLDISNNHNVHERGAYDTTGVPKPPPPKPRNHEDLSSDIIDTRRENKDSTLY